MCKQCIIFCYQTSESNLRVDLQIWIKANKNKRLYNIIWIERLSVFLSPCLAWYSWTLLQTSVAQRTKGIESFVEASDAMEGRPSGASLISPRESRFEVNSAADG